MPRCEIERKQPKKSSIWQNEGGRKGPVILPISGRRDLESSIGLALSSLSDEAQASLRSLQADVKEPKNSILPRKQTIY